MHNKVFPKIVPFMRQCRRVWFRRTGNKYNTIPRFCSACWV